LAVTGDPLWRDSALTVARDTAAAVEALVRVGGHGARVAEAVQEIGAAPADSAELRARRAELVTRRAAGGPAEGQALVDGLLAERGDDGGWATAPRYASDPLTTARAIRALAAAGRPAEVAEAWGWLESAQNADGGWPWQVGGPSSTVATLEVLLTARLQAPNDFWAWPAVARGVAWALSRQRGDGFGDLYPEIVATALFLQLTLDQPVDPDLRHGAVTYLASRQQSDGSWQGSPYKTGLVVSAVAPSFLPDFGVEGSELSVEPESPYETEQATARAAIRNFGETSDAALVFRWRVLPLGSETPVFVLDGSAVPPAAGDVVTVEAELPSDFVPGRYRLRVEIDPDGLGGERSRANNRAEVPFTVRAHPPGVDLVLTDRDIAAAPDAVASSPQVLEVSGVVRNEGLTSAPSTEIAVYDAAVNPLGTGPAGRLGTVTVDVPSLDFAPFSVAVELTDARGHQLMVSVDPESRLDDADRFNQRATVLVPLQLRPDLAVVEFSAAPSALALGETTRLTAEIRNVGTVPLADFDVIFERAEGADPVLIQRLSVTGPLAPGGAMELTAEWSPNRAGVFELAAEVDPSGVTGDADPGNDRRQTTVDVAGSGLPNLRVTPDDLELDPVRPQQGQPVTFRARVGNPSAVDAPAFSVELWLDAPTAGAGGTRLVDEAVPGRAAGGGVAVEATVPVESFDERLFFAVVDPADAVAEFSELDNEAFLIARVDGLPDLQLSRGGVDVTPEFPRQGETLRFSVDVRNGGDQPAPASTLELLGAVDTVLLSAPVGALAAGEATLVDVEWDPAGAVGELGLALRVVGPPGFDELDAANNRVDVPLTVQDGDLAVARQIFSPNGDGVRDTATVFFRGGVDGVRLVDGAGLVVRTLDVTPGGQSAEWDGRDDGGEVVPDGVYRVRADLDGRQLETWAAVDNNLSAVGERLAEKLVVGFVEPQIPGDGPDAGRFTSRIGNPLTDEVYLVERRPAPGGGADGAALVRFAGGDLLDIGPYPDPSAPVRSASLAGDLFVIGEFGGERLLRYPGAVEQALSPPGGFGTPWISPDGRWLLWLSFFDKSLVLQELGGAGAVHDHRPTAGSGNPCGYSLRWTGRSRAVVSVVVDGGDAYFVEIDAGAEPPTFHAVEAEGAVDACGGGGFERG
ncbi:MAG: CARDB domain-containing protein, partial [Acidobacteriota bacterium]